MNEKRESYIRTLDEYYQKLGRQVTPDYRDYSLVELRKCFRMYHLPFPAIDNTHKISGDNKWILPKV